MRELHRRVHAGEQVNPAESLAWRKWRGFLPSEPRRKKKRKKKKLPKGGFLPGCGRLRDLQRQVPAVQVVHVFEGAPATIHRQSGGHSCFSCRDVYPQCKLCRTPWSSYRCCSWTVPPPGSGGVGFGPFSNLSRCTPSSSCVCHRVWLGYEHGFRRPSLERDVQWDVRVHSSSCGAHRDVVHSPFGWLYHRCHCNCRDLVLFVGRMCCGGVCVAMSCGGPDGAYNSIWDSVRPMTGKYIVYYFQYQEVVGVYAC